MGDVRLDAREELRKELAGVEDAANLTSEHFLLRFSAANIEALPVKGPLISLLA